jgi:hypothetical protein
MSDDDDRDYYDRKVRRAEETLALLAKVAFVAIAGGLIWELIKHWG